jgi:hypothetical protein
MNREIKFRAWDTLNKKMYGQTIENGNIQFWYYCFFDSSFIQMQYTWLKDNNWKEIYENDYVNYKWCLYRIFFNKFKISLENISIKDIIDLTDEILSDLSIKWNIYENQ